MENGDSAVQDGQMAENTITAEGYIIDQLGRIINHTAAEYGRAEEIVTKILLP